MAVRTHPLLGKEVLVHLYFEEGISLRGIAQHTGTNYRLVRDSFRACGLNWKSKSEARRGRKWDEDTKAKIAAAHLGQHDAPEVAEKKRIFLKTAGGRGWNKGLTSHSDERVARQRAAAVKVMRTPEWRERRSRQTAARIRKGGYWERGYCDTSKEGRLYYMSGWEQRRWLELDGDSEVTSFTRHPCQVPYLWEGVQHLYLPDVLIQYRDGTKVLEEIKPYLVAQDARKKENRLAAKLVAGRAYALARGWVWRMFSYDGEGGGPFIFS